MGTQRSPAHTDAPGTAEPRRQDLCECLDSMSFKCTSPQGKHTENRRLANPVDRGGGGGGGCVADGNKALASASSRGLQIKAAHVRLNIEMLLLL